MSLPDYNWTGLRAVCRSKLCITVKCFNKKNPHYNKIRWFPMEFEFFIGVHMCVRRKLDILRSRHWTHFKIIYSLFISPICIGKHTAYVINVMLNILVYTQYKFRITFHLHAEVAKQNWNSLSKTFRLKINYSKMHSIEQIRFIFVHECHN